MSPIDQELINTYVSAQKEIEEARAVIEKEKEEQEEVKGILDDKEDELKELQEEKDQMIDSINQRHCGAGKAGKTGTGGLLTTCRRS